VGNPQPIALKGALESDYPVRFPTSGGSLLVSSASGGELLVTLVDLASGHRESWKRIPIEVQARGHYFGFNVTPNLKYYAYSSPRYTSDLYIVHNLH
jgi:hypothetical protein